MRLTGKNQAIRRLHTLIALTLMQEGNTVNSRLVLFNCLAQYISREADSFSGDQKIYPIFYGTRKSLTVQVGFTLSQATKVLRESRGIALLYFRPLH